MSIIKSFMAAAAAALSSPLAEASSLDQAFSSMAHTAMPGPYMGRGQPSINYEKRARKSNAPARRYGGGPVECARRQVNQAHARAKARARALAARRR